MRAPAETIEPGKAHVVGQWKHTSPLIGCRFDPEGRFVFAGSQDNTIIRWDMTGKSVLFSGHKSWVRAVAFAGRERLLFSADWAGKLFAWQLDADKPAPKWGIAAHRGWARALAVSPDGQTLASCGNDGLVKLWSIPDGKAKRSLSGHDCHVYNVAYHPEGRFLVSADLKGSVKVWDLARGEVVRELDAKVLHKYDPTFMADIGGVRSMAFDGEGKHLVCAGITNVTNAFAGIGNPLVLLFDWATGKLKQQLRPKTAFQGMAWGVVFHPQGYVLGVGGGNGGALWAWKGNEALASSTLTLPGNSRDLALHPDLRRVAIPFFDGVLRLYDLTSKKA